MNFEDAGLPDSPMMRRAFLMTQFHIMGITIVKDDGTRLPATMDLQLRTAEILRQTVPGASDEQIAAGLMFLTSSFARSGALLMHRSGDDKLMPNVCAWSEEWQDVQKGRKLLEDASKELRQILTAASVAQFEDYKKNFADVDQWALRRLLMEDTRMSREMGDIGAPALASAHKGIRGELDLLLNGQNPAPAANPSKPGNPGP